MNLLTVTLYTRENCHLCEDAKQDLQSLQAEIPHHLVEIDIDESPGLVEKFGLEIPVVETGPFTLKAPFGRQKLKMTLGAARDRQNQLIKVEDAAYQKRLTRGQQINAADRFTLWFSKYWLWVFNLFVLLYVGLPVLAPALMQADIQAPAKLIYRVYGGLCHQLSYRSWFIFGEQPLYPRESAGLEGYATFQQATGLDESGLVAARQYLGEQGIGYKMALCQRDMAIYGGILLFGVMFGLTGRRWKSLPVWLWLLLAIVPIGIDGVSQLASQMLAQLAASSQISLIHTLADLLPYRESTPFLRTLTGFLFGFMTAWFGYPLVEETMQEANTMLTTKYIQVETISQQPNPKP